MRNLLAVLFSVALVTTSLAQNRHEGYYYPPIQSEEIFDRIAVEGPAPLSEARNDLVTSMSAGQIVAPYAPRYVMFTKGAASEKLIIIALDDEIFANLYRARAVMAFITSDMRGGEFFIRAGLQFEGTFYDMLQMFGFEELVISDGTTWSHRVTFVRN